MAALRARKTNNEADQPSSPVLRFGPDKPLKLDAGLAFLASNISLPFIAPFITFAEIEAGARVLHGAWLVITPDDARKIDVKQMLGELAVGTPFVAAGCAAVGGALAYGISSLARRRRATAR